MLFKENETLVFIGDSVPECGRSYPDGEGQVNQNPLGNGFPAFVNAMMTALHPELHMRIINKGIGGNQSRHLVERWQQDVLDYNPDYVCIMIGTNDIWRQFDFPRMKHMHVYIDEYEKNVEKLIVDTKDKVKGIIIMTPVFIDYKSDDPMRKAFEAYSAVLKKLAEKHGCMFLDEQKVIDRLCEYDHPYTIAYDRIHPCHTGHMAMALDFMKATGAM
jgi:lysophospholipase L1-like esterase